MEGVFGINVQIKSDTKRVSVARRLWLSLKIFDAKSSSGILFLDIDRENMGDVWLTFIRNARACISLAALINFS